jgi:hypothetical protein
MCRFSQSSIFIDMPSAFMLMNAIILNVVAPIRTTVRALRQGKSALVLYQLKTF